MSRTLSRLGEIVKDDVKLGTLYLTLVLATPPSEATPETKVSWMATGQISNILVFIEIFSVQSLATLSPAGGGTAALQISLQQIPGG